MKQKAIRLLIVDDNVELCDILETFLGLTTEIEVCGIANNGEDALAGIAQTRPDVVLLDLILPKTDGIAVLERLKMTNASQRPKVIVTSDIGQESVTTTALALGADSYMLKPYDLYDLCARIKLVSSSHSPKSDSLEILVSRALMGLGISTHMRGYHYCAAALMILLSEERGPVIVKEVYGDVAQQCKTTPACVESAIRRTIYRSWKQDRMALAAVIGPGEENPPSNGRFLGALCARIRITMDSSAGGNHD